MHRQCIVTNLEALKNRTRMLPNGIDLLPKPPQSFLFGPVSATQNQPIRSTRKKSISPKDESLWGFGAANQIRTGDLILTKDVLYHLSHSSGNKKHYSGLIRVCQAFFCKFPNFVKQSGEHGRSFTQMRMKDSLVRLFPDSLTDGRFLIREHSKAVKKNFRGRWRFF